MIKSWGMEKKKFLQSYDPGSTLIFMTSYPFLKILFFFNY